jgi:outer membrane protein OmpA-like peptidoglycan-associated protein
MVSRKPWLVAISVLVFGANCFVGERVRAADQQPALTVASDAQTQYSLDGRKWQPAVATWVHPSWPALKGATWIWTVAKVSKEEAVKGSPIVTFVRKFSLPDGSSTNATLQITADNAYEASLNGKVIGTNGVLDAASTSDQQWHGFDSYTVTLKSGENVLSVRAINYHSPLGASADGESNPGGLVFRLDGTPSLAQTIAATGKVDIYGILFDVDKADIKPESKPTLDQVADLLKGDPALKLEVSGHTDNSGGRSHNMALSRRRAAAVVAALLKDYGIAADRLTARGYGDTRPVAPNDSVDNKAKNRRVELRKI